MSITQSVWILGDQLLLEHPALLAAEETVRREQITVVLIESQNRRRKYPYQRKKLVLLLSAMRHYARALEERGYRVDYRKAATFTTGLRQHLAEYTPKRLVTMAASHYAGCQFQHKQLPDLLQTPVDLLPNTQFLVAQFDPFPNPEPEKRYVMENFYRAMRRYFDVLMESDKPVGGAWNFDKENRKPLPKDLEPPAVASYLPDAITQEVMAEVAAEQWGIGTVDDFALAVTHQQAASAFGNFIAHRLEKFGTYEDAMTRRHNTLYHSVLSPYLNLGLLEPMPVIRAAERAFREDRAPINSVEGFVRQVLGWREFIYWQYWRQMPGLLTKNSWHADRALPSFFWDGTETEMNCLRHAIQRAIDTGYTHHIERLMLLCNFAMLAGLDPRAVNDWFMSLYVDAYDWVMPPNVIGMGLNADGGLTATKPYISSANYINKMGDYCTDCRYQAKERTGDNACPFNFLYWNFLIKHEERLRANVRLGKNVLGLRHLDQAERQKVQTQAAAFLDAMT